MMTMPSAASPPGDERPSPTPVLELAAAAPAARPATAAQKRQILAAEYRARALEASTLAAASPLDRVREKHEAAADRWRMLAELSERDSWVAPLRGQAAVSSAGIG